MHFIKFRDFYLQGKRIAFINLMHFKHYYEIYSIIIMAFN